MNVYNWTKLKPVINNDEVLVSETKHDFLLIVYILPLDFKEFLHIITSFILEW